MQKIINIAVNIVVILAVLISGFFLYKVDTLGNATIQAVGTVNTLQNQQGAALMQVVCRAGMDDLVVDSQKATCNQIREAYMKQIREAQMKQQQAVTATPQTPAP